MNGSLGGQWLADYMGSNTGVFVLNLDEIGDYYQGWGMAWDSNPVLPTAAGFLQIKRGVTEGSLDVPLLTINPNPQNGFPVESSLVAFMFSPQVVFPSRASLTFALEPDGLHISVETDIDTHIAGTAPRTQAGAPTEYIPLPEVTDWETYKTYVARLDYRRHIFRGQAKPRRLRTAFHRTGRADLFRFLTDDRIELHRHLSSRTKHLFDLNIPDQNGAFLSLAQHHGYPTPLLDWTYSPYIAAFFAYREITNAQAAKAKANEKVRIFVFDRQAWTTDFFQSNVLSPRGPHFSIMHFVATENERLIPQQSVSSVTNVDDIETYIRRKESEAGKTYLTVVDLPIRERAKVMHELSVMGITAGSMLPGFDGICEALKERMFP